MSVISHAIKGDTQRQIRTSHPSILPLFIHLASMSGFQQSLALVEAKKAALVIIAHDVDPIKLVAFQWIEGMPKASL
jgi:hypothetical protein